MLILLGSFLALMLLGVPVALAMAVSSLLFILATGTVPDVIVAQRMIAGVESFPLLAVPFFILAGNLMNIAGVTGRIYDFALALVGWMKGGLGQVNVVASTLFGGISGSAVADASAIGGIMIPQMEKRGYAKDYAVNVTVNAAIIALLIPPSHNMIIYSIAGGGTISVADLFTAGIVPGMLLAAALILILNAGIGLNTPPVGSVLFVGCAVARISIGEAMRTIWPFLGASVAVLMLVTYVPALSLWLPALFR